jgi:hypothetical protein
MCKFCYELGKIKKEISWQVRSSMSTQNIEDYNELPSEWDGKHRVIKYQNFTLTIYGNYDEGIRISVDYELNTNDGIIISPFSEAIQWSFCPFCGEQISKKIVVAEELYGHQFSIEDNQEYELRD